MDEPSYTHLMLDFSNGFLLRFKYQCKGDTNHEGKSCKDKPTRLPLTNKKALLLTIYDKVLPIAETINDLNLELMP